MTEVSLQTTSSTFLLIIFCLAAVLASYFVYRKTVPPVHLGWRILLMSLRASAIIAIIILLFEPILSLTRKHHEKPVVAVLVDNSASMGLVDNKVNRPEVLQQMLASDLFTESGDYEFRYYFFSHSLGEPAANLPDSLVLEADGTDIAAALRQVKEGLSEDYFAAVVMLTDGANNVGENPARYATKYGIPIHTVGIGDPGQQKDVLITNYVTNEVVYAGKPVPVEVFVKSSGFESTRATVTLLRDGETLDSEMFNLAGGGLEQKIRLHFTPQDEGLEKYEVRVSQLDGELTGANNVKPFYTKVLKSKLTITVIAGGPGADLKFLKRALAADNNLQVQSFVERHRGKFYQGAAPAKAAMQETDGLVLLDYPRRDSDAAVIEAVRGLLAEGKPVLLLSGKNTDFDKLWGLRDFLPFAGKPKKTREASVYAKVLPAGTHHPVLRIYEDDFENTDRWKNLPPVFANTTAATIRPGALTLTAIDSDREPAARSPQTPLISAYNSGKRKSIAVLAYGLWRWDLLMTGAGKSNANYEQFIQNAVRWLTTQENSKLVRVTSNREIYRSGEEVKFTAQVYFEDYQPVDAAEVAVQLTGENATQELTLSSLGDGQYEGSFQVLDGGDYSFSGTAHLQGRVLGRDGGKFSVEPFSLEFQDTRMDQVLLQRISAESGGTFHTQSDLGTLSAGLAFPDKYVSLTSEWEIWNRPQMLIIFILLLASEWFIRKRKGML